MYEDPELIRQHLNDVCKRFNFKKKDFFPLLRFALTGRTEGLDLGDIIFVLGEEGCKKRLDDFEQFLIKNTEDLV